MPVQTRINPVPMEGVNYKYRLGQVVKYVATRPHSSRSMIGFTGKIIGYAKSVRDNSPMYNIFFDQYCYESSVFSEVPHTVFEDNIVLDEPTWEL